MLRYGFKSWLSIILQSFPYDIKVSVTKVFYAFYQRRQQQQYLGQNDSFEEQIEKESSSNSTINQAEDTFYPDFVLESDKEQIYSQTPHRSDQAQDDQKYSQEIMDYEKDEHDRDPFNQFNYSPTPDDDFAEFDKYFNGFDESRENQPDNFREGRYATDVRGEIERNSQNVEQLDKFRVITKPFDVSDLKYNDEVKISRSI